MRCDHEVIDRLLARKKHRNDGHKIGLIVQGGGMRGAFSSGAMMGLDELGLTKVFDYVYGSSSGSCASAYLLSGQIQEAGSVYWDYLYNFRFIKPWKWGKILDLDYLCDDIFRNDRKLDVARLRKNPAILKIYLTDSKSGRSEFVTNKDETDIITAIKASCSMPAYFREPILVNERACFDGNVGKELPFEEALRDGCTDLLVVATIAEDSKDFRPLNRFMLIGLSEKAKSKVESRMLNYQENLDMVFGKKKFKGMNIYTVSPDMILFRGEIRKSVLQKSGEEGRSKILKAFKGGHE